MFTHQWFFNLNKNFTLKKFSYERKTSLCPRINPIILGLTKSFHPIHHKVSWKGRSHLAVDSLMDNSNKSFLHNLWF